jgi:hypothetical protein
MLGQHPNQGQHPNLPPPSLVLQSMAFIQHCRSMKEAGFTPKLVYRNLPPSHLYEKVCWALSCMSIVAVAASATMQHFSGSTWTMH